MAAYTQQLAQLRAGIGLVRNGRGNRAAITPAEAVEPGDVELLE